MMKAAMPKRRNPVVLIARTRNSAGPMHDRRKRREKDRLRKELRFALDTGAERG
jgi:hypothetical protein